MVDHHSPPPAWSPRRPRRRTRNPMRATTPPAPHATTKHDPHHTQAPRDATCLRGAPQTPSGTTKRHKQTNTEFTKQISVPTMHAHVGGATVTLVKERLSQKATWLGGSDASARSDLHASVSVGVLAWRYHDLGAPEGSSSFLGGGRLSNARPGRVSRGLRMPVIVRPC